MIENKIKIVECPRDAMQGIVEFIPTEQKIAYLNQLLEVGFDTLDFGSFVSPKAIPQLADTAEVLAGLDLTKSDTKLLAIIANLRGAESAVAFPEIHYLGYPFSISETFQIRNTRKTIAESLDLVKEMQALCEANGKTLVVYISMGFGNPYGDDWSPEIAANWVKQIAAIGVKIISLADTVGSADAKTIRPLFETLIPAFPAVEFGAHFHAAAAKRMEKLKAAWEGGCRRFDTAMLGFGGCPFAEDDLVGNISTEALLTFLENENLSFELNEAAFSKALITATEVFSNYH